ncbi:hypothetical protein [Larkinella sp.]|uniref:hypothetical protein n=1 Tax=Larkinella sp. TaxID=2034517 RepID=UPI003BA89319
MISINWVFIAFLFIILFIVSIYIITNTRRDKFFIEILTYLMGAFIAFLFFTISSYLMYNFIDSSKTQFEKLEKSLQVGVSVAGFLSLIVSIKIFRDTDRRQLSQATLNLFEKFTDTKFAEIRYAAWEVRRKWFHEKGYKEKYIASAFPPNDVESEMSSDNDFREDIKNVRDLFDFFSTLVAYEDSKETIRICRLFYYGWWRNFLYEIAKVSDQYYTPNIEIKQKYKYTFNYSLYAKTVSYVAILKKLDIIFEFEGVKEEEIFHKY